MQIVQKYPIVSITINKETIGIIKKTKIQTMRDAKVNLIRKHEIFKIKSWDSEKYNDELKYSYRKKERIRKKNKIFLH